MAVDSGPLAALPFDAMDEQTQSLVDGVLRGDRRLMSRALTQVENQTLVGRALLRALFPHTGRAHVVGVTGAPGSGKSTLVNQLALEARRRGRQVGIIAVDPTSPISGGAVLGDRVRMQDLWQDPGIFLRSMASRDALGGLAEATGGLISVMDAAGKDLLIVETVGVGQAEVDIVREAHTAIVVVIPGMGDEIQAMKAGLMEIADIFVVNKSDRDGADMVAKQIRSMLTLGERPAHMPPILNTVATRGEGLDVLLNAIEKHRAYLDESGTLHARITAQARHHILALARDTLLERLRTGLPAETLDAIVAEVAEKRKDPYTAANDVVKLITAHDG